MFPTDRFSSLLPETEKLRKELDEAINGACVVQPRTAAELGTRPVLHQFFPAWDVQAYVRMAKLRLHVHNSKYPTYEATGELPQLSDGNFLVPKDEIVQHLQTFHVDLDDGLDDVQKSESFAYRAMVREKLERVLMFCCWVDPITYKEVTRPHLKKHIPFPLNHFLPKKMHLATTKTLQECGFYSKEQAYVVARDSYTALNAKLASSSGPYFFGDRVSALDAIVFGHIVDALSDPQLSKTVYQYAPLLVTHAERIRDTYFSMESEGNRPRSLSMEHLQASYYSQNHENVFTQTEHNFMKKVPPTLHVTFLEPYRSLNWSRRELLRDVAKSKAERSHDEGEEETTWYGMPKGQGFDKSARNVIVGAVAAIVLYALANLPLAIRFSDDEDGDEDLDDEDGEVGVYDYSGDDDDDYYEE
ncbi:hypothetical protein ATCC90586_006293 [Pythium insidiosum]|nr:hypothetical protein ATCC90586_006293 [Pythium insidiosum]